MKLYLSPGACSFAVHIALREADLAFSIEQVIMGTKKTKSGADFLAINPKGYVPALALDSGEILTEAVAVLQYVADRKPETKLAPAAGTMERYRLQEWLTFISSEVHKGFGPLFSPKAPEEWKEVAKENLGKRFDWLNRQLEGRSFLMDTFTVADAYLFTVLRWVGYAKIDLGRWPALKAYFDRVGERPAVRAALAAEKALS